MNSYCVIEKRIICPVFNDDVRRFTTGRGEHCIGEQLVEMSKNGLHAVRTNVPIPTIRHCATTARNTQGACMNAVASY
jgi:hypothetical protein